MHSEDCMYVDKFKMDQVIRNLISNALKFTPRGGSVCVTVRRIVFCILSDVFLMTFLRDYVLDSALTVTMSFI